MILGYTEDEVEMLYQIANSPGWLLVNQYVAEQVKQATTQLQTATPTDAAKIASLQEQIRSIPRVVNHINNVMAELQKRERNEVE